MKVSGAHGMRWRIAVTFASVLALVLSPALLQGASADAPVEAFTMTTAPRADVVVPLVGQPVNILPGSWSPEPSGFAYQWLLNGSPIENASASQYTPTTGEIGQGLSFTETVSLDGVQSTTYTSVAYRIDGVFTQTTLTLAGLAQVGSTLTATLGDIEPTPALVTYTWRGGGGVNLQVGTSNTYTLAASDVGSEIQVFVAARSASYEGELVYSNVSDPVLPLAYDSFTPQIVGTQVVGSTLSVGPLYLFPTPDETEYQWMSNGVPIDGATGPTYEPVATDLGTTISVSVTVCHSDLPSLTEVGTATGTVNEPFTGTPTPTITGTAVIGSTLFAHPGMWAPAGASFTYAWLVDGYWTTPQPGKKYPVANYVGSTVEVRVTATAPGYGPTTSPASLPTAPIAAVSEHVSPITISGHVGINDLVAPVVQVLPTSPWGVPVTYQWMLNGVPIPGATTSTYLPVISDYGNRVSLTVSVDDPDWGDSSATSNSVVVGIGDLSPEVPVIGGTPAVGSTLRDDPAVPWGPGPAHVYYYWYELGTQPYGETLLSEASTFTPTAALIGDQVQLWESASEPDFNTFSGRMLSQPVTITAGHITQVSAPTISGPPEVGATLAASSGVWSQSSGLTFGYQWFATPKAGGAATAIAGATGNTYVPTKAQAGSLISVRVIASEAGYASDSVFSAATAPLILLHLVAGSQPE